MGSVSKYFTSFHPASFFLGEKRIYLMEDDTKGWKMTRPSARLLGKGLRNGGERKKGRRGEEVSQVLYSNEP